MTGEKPKSVRHSPGLPYVSHRVEEIQTSSLGDPGRLNPADVATRSIQEEEALPSKWWEGPDFLRSLKEE